VSLTRAETTDRDQIAVTRPSRTLADLRARAPDQLYRRALRQAEFLGLHLGVESDADHTRSELERRADRARDNELVSLGYQLLRFTYAAVLDRPRATVSLVSSRLRRAV
jgi:hypothetical protein